MTNLSTTTLADLIAKRHACLTQLRAIGLKQADLIATSEIGPLLRLLSGKQQLIAALESIEHALRPFQEQEPDVRQWSSPEIRTACADQAAECRYLLEEVMKLEQANEQQMTLRRDEVTTQLQSATAASRARGAYRAHQQHAAPAPQRIHQATVNRTTSRLDLSSDA